jgi:YidC/Oxa1 family membrane protein insertase
MMNRQDDMHPEDRRNLVIFIIASLLVWYLFDNFLLQPRLEALKQTREAQTQQLATPSAIAAPEIARDREDVLREVPRLSIDNPAVAGSLSLTGGRFDDLRLKKYVKTLHGTDNVVLLSPVETEHPKYVEFGWLPDETKKINIPGPETRWQAEGGNRLSPESPVTLYWENGQGVRFEQRLSIDANYLVTVTQRVINHGAAPVSLYPYALIAQKGLPEGYQGNRIAHEGPLAYLDGQLMEIPYNKLVKEPQQDVKAGSGWIGMSEKYWFTSVIPPQQDAKTFRFLRTPALTKDGKDKYQVDYVGPVLSVPPGGTSETTNHLFAGAKELRLLNQYEKSIPAHHFDLAVDFGLWYFLTKPIFYILDFLARTTGNFGIALIILTIAMRAAVFPLASTSFRSFAKMKKISPYLKELREKHSGDKVRLQEELVKLYEREKVNPMAGCFPIIVQIPIFFALYKVLSITIEMRHAPFYGWIHDLSAQDPTTIFNLFGLIPWTPPSPLMIGAWPCLMLLAMLVQRNLNPPPQDPSQAMMVNVMPFFMTYVMAKFAAGLVIYWTLSNTLSVLQQYVIMRSMGVPVHLFRRGKEDKEMEEMVRKGPNVHPGLEVMEDEVEDALFSRKDGEVAPAVTVSPPKKKKKKKK